jgi:P27 family predicted phage terminase small subunit
MSILKAADAEVLAGLCQNWALFVRASKVLNKMTIDGSFEIRRTAATASEAYKNYLRACEQFGLTPSARTRIDVGIETKQEDALDRLLAGKAG